MSRPRGTRNTDFEATRAALAAKIAARMQAPDGVGVSFRELATAAGVTPPTLTHYFGNRAGALQAAHAALHHAGQPYLAAARRGIEDDVQTSLTSVLRFLLDGLRAGVARQLVSGLGEAGSEAGVGAACVTECLEPVLGAVESRLASHVARGELVIPDLRAAALLLVSPVVLGVLHQDALEGRRVRPLDLEALITDIVGGFLRGHLPRA